MKQVKPIFLPKIKTNKNKTVAVSGHRNLSYGINKDIVEKTFLSLIERGFDTFLVGMAIGFDTLCFNILSELRNKYDIKIIACIPCLDQSLKFSESSKTEYTEMLKISDDKVLISLNYTKNCMLDRNVYMVNNSSVLVAYIRENKGGTYFTVNYAKNENKEIIFV